MLVSLILDVSLTHSAAKPQPRSSSRRHAAALSSSLALPQPSAAADHLPTAANQRCQSRAAKDIWNTAS